MTNKPLETRLREAAKEALSPYELAARVRQTEGVNLTHNQARNLLLEYSAYSEYLSGRNPHTPVRSNLEMEAALNMWEAFLTNGHLEPLIWRYQEHHGAVAARHLVMDNAQHVANAWTIAERFGADGCYDWEFTPAFLYYGFIYDGNGMHLRPDWRLIAAGLGKSGMPYRMPPPSADQEPDTGETGADTPEPEGMSVPEALAVIWGALEAYAEACISSDTEAQEEVTLAWRKVQKATGYRTPEGKHEQSCLAYQDTPKPEAAT